MAAELALKKKGGRPKRPFEKISQEEKKLRDSFKKFKDNKMQELELLLRKVRVFLESLKVEQAIIEKVLEMNQKNSRSKWKKNSRRSLE